MAKGQKRNSREAKKPKTKKQPAPATDSNLFSRISTPMTTSKKKS